jgi:predicted extracellular nuclease
MKRLRRPSPQPRWLVLGVGLAVILVTLASSGRLFRFSTSADGIISITTLGTPITENFNTLATAGTTNTALPNGFSLTESGGGARDNEQYAADTGSSNTGDTYSYGASGDPERALGGLRSGTLIPIFGATFTNNTGTAITNLAISYTGEQWRLGTADRGPDRLDFQISTDATSISTGTWTDVNALDFSGPVTTAPVGARNGNAAENRVAISSTLAGLNIPNGATFLIRWLDLDVTGADDGLAIDDFSITADAVATPTDPSGVGVAAPPIVAPGGSSLLTVTVTPGANPTSTGITVTGDLTTIGGLGAQSFFDNGTNGDENAGDNVFSFLANVPLATVQETKNLPISIADAQGRTASTTISLIVQEVPLVVVSQVYGGGGNAGATLRNDFIEIFNRGTSPVSLAGWSVQYNSAAGAGNWQVTPITGTIPAGGYYLIQEAAGAGGTEDLPAPDATGTIAMAAGAGKVALVSTTTPLNGSCPVSANIIDQVGYGAATCFEGSGPAPTLTNTTAALRARGGCRDTNDNSVDFSSASPAPRNSASPLRDCSVPPPFFAISAIQGDGATTPLVGQEVTSSGIVTARKSNGFFMQTPDGSGDSNPATSEGIFVFTGSTPTVAPGDSVSVVGTAGEFFNLTQLSSSGIDVTVLSSGNAVPAAITLTTTILNPAGPINQLERFECMRMQAASLVSVAPTNEFGEIFTVLPGVARPLREPGIEVSLPLPPGSPCCVPRFDQNPERIMIDTDGLVGSTRVNVTSSVTLSNVIGPLDFTFDDYKITPEVAPTAGPNMSATPVPVASSNEFTVGSFNLENFFLTNGNFADRLNKASLAIRNVMRSPDIIGVEEVGDLPTLTALADKLNADSGSPSPAYQAFLLETDNDAEQDIDVGFLVKTSRVTVVSVTQVGADATYINPLNGQAELLNDRAPLILRAKVRSPQGLLFPVTVVVNHLRSLIDVDQDPGDGPRVREKRRKQAEFLANLLESIEDENLVVVGDFNAFQFNDGYVDVMGTIRGNPTPSDQVVLASPDLVNPNLIELVDLLPQQQRYSFVFEGNAQVLDHVLLNLRMLLFLNRFAYARNNSDFPDSFGNDPTRSERVSDHDMPVAYFRFPPTLPVIPLIECVTRGSGNNFTAQFGYLSPNLYEIEIPVGPNNRFAPAPENRGQTTIFQPGLNLNQFSVAQNGGTLSWTLNGIKVSATRNFLLRCRN